MPKPAKRANCNIVLSDIIPAPKPTSFSLFESLALCFLVSGNAHPKQHFVKKMPWNRSKRCFPRKRHLHSSCRLGREQRSLDLQEYNLVVLHLTRRSLCFGEMICEPIGRSPSLTLATTFPIRSLTITADLWEVALPKVR